MCEPIHVQYRRGVQTLSWEMGVGTQKQKNGIIITTIIISFFDQRKHEPIEIKYCIVSSYDIARNGSRTKKEKNERVHRFWIRDICWHSKYVFEGQNILWVYSSWLAIFNEGYSEGFCESRWVTPQILLFAKGEQSLEMTTTTLLEIVKVSTK